MVGLAGPNGGRTVPRAGGSRGRLTRERVVAAALAIVDRDGLDGLTMRALGRELRVDPMAAYHWFPNKLAILQGVSEAILAEISLDSFEDAADWIDVGRDVAFEYRAALLRHPNALVVAASQPVMSASGIELIERTAAAMVALGWTAGGAIEAINMIASYVVGSCMVEAASSGTERVGEDAALAFYQAMDPARFPTVAAAVAQGSDNHLEDDGEIDVGVEAMLRGIDAVARERGLLAANPQG